jgi:hypothetical protein
MVHCAVSNGLASAVHHPSVWMTACVRNDEMSRPIVGISQRSTIASTATFTGQR